MQLYRYMLADESCVVVPEHRPELSTQRLLTMNWLDGTRLMPFLDTNPGQDTRNKIARHMFRVWYVPFYYYGVIHGDPHLGNYSIASDHRINLMDFDQYGCSGQNLLQVSLSSIKPYVMMIRHRLLMPMKGGDLLA